MDFIDFYARATPTPRAKQAPTAWEGKDGESARARGVNTADEFAVFTAITEECRKTGNVGAHLSHREIARRLRASPDGVEKIVDGLLARGVIRAQIGLLGLRLLVPSSAN